MADDIRSFLRTLSNAELEEVKATAKAALLAGTYISSVSVNGKTSGATQFIPPALLLSHLGDVLVERGYAVSTPARMTYGRFA